MFSNRTKTKHKQTKKDNFVAMYNFCEVDSKKTLGRLEWFPSIARPQ